MCLLRRMKLVGDDTVSPQTFTERHCSCHRRARLRGCSLSIVQVPVRVRRRKLGFSGIETSAHRVADLFGHFHLLSALAVPGQRTRHGVHVGGQLGDTHLERADVRLVLLSLAKRARRQSRVLLNFGRHTWSSRAHGSRRAIKSWRARSARGC